MGMTLSTHTQRLEPPGGSLATRGYDPSELLFFVSVCLAFWCVCVFVHLYECALGVGRWFGVGRIFD